MIQNDDKMPIFPLDFFKSRPIMINNNRKQPKYAGFLVFIHIKSIYFPFLPVPHTIYHLIVIAQIPLKNRKVVYV